MIIVDEEHDNSYISDSAPRYKTGDIVRQISQILNNYLATVGPPRVRHYPPSCTIFHTKFHIYFNRLSQYLGNFSNFKRLFESALSEKSAILGEIVGFESVNKINNL